MGNLISTLNKINIINFEDVLNNLNNKNYIIINTLNENNQNCLIINTINIDKEVEIINNYIKKDKSINIIIYGKNCSDKTIISKYYQLLNLGFQNLFIYFGGMFEWLLLQDIYGKDAFITTTNEIDILKYK